MTTGAGFEAVFLYKSSASCKVSFYLFYLNGHLSAWSVTLLTIERFLAIWFPLKFRDRISTKHIILAWVTMATVLCLIDLTMIFVIDYNPEIQFGVQCELTSEHWREVWERLDLFLTCIGPFVIICILNGLILFKLYSTKKKMTNAKSGEEDSLGGITAMMLSICLLFIVTTMPITIYAYQYKVSEDALTNARSYLLMTMLTKLYFLNHCMNFILYLATGKRFRAAFFNTFCRCRAEKTKKKMKFRQWLRK
jgi:hypothetical protein